MPDILRTSLSGMLAFQSALEVTGHNIANANTPGYSRQVVEFASRAGQDSGAGFIGSGTQISQIKRIYDEVLAQQYRTASTGQARFSVLNSLASRLDSLLADPTTGLNSGMQSFFQAVQDVSNDPGSVSARQALLGEANGLAQRVNALGERLAETEAEVNQRIRVSVGTINDLAGSIANINDRIASTGGLGGDQPNDLLDQRDALVHSLAQEVSVTTALQDDGTLSVFVGAGQALVIGKEVNEFAVRGNSFDPTRLEVVTEGATGSTPIGAGMSGGTLGGLLEFRTQMLDSTRQSLGRTATALVSTVNQQHAAGLDLRGALGQDFFGIDDPTVLHSSSNTGAGDAAVQIVDASQMTGGDYVLTFDGAAYSLERSNSGEVVPMTGSGTTADPFLAEGLAIAVSGAPAAGDALLIRSVSDAPSSVRVAITEPQSIAMAAPTRTSASLGNLGDATITAPTVADINDASLLSTAVIEFTSPTTYSVNGTGSYAFSDGAPITINGSQFTISGQPATNDTFTLQANFGAPGDNRNALLIGDLQAVDLLDDGTVSIMSSYGSLVAGVGSTTRQISASLDAQGVLVGNTEAAHLAKTGVNVDEEAANLIRFQQAYQASAQVVSIVNTLFQTLLNATAR